MDETRGEYIRHIFECCLMDSKLYKEVVIEDFPYDGKRVNLYFIVPKILGRQLKIFLCGSKKLYKKFNYGAREYLCELCDYVFKMQINSFEFNYLGDTYLSSTINTIQDYDIENYLICVTATRK